MTKALGDIIPGSTVVMNKIPKSYVDYELYNNLVHNEDENEKFFEMLPRSGAFEVSYKGYVSKAEIDMGKMI